ncbi:MAG: alpha/beta fold hydrolase [Candidatus Obscuribacterales bacterium]|nr:alpha/beta fold hydrolase [Candidatus Obscuribacterales bacterium]
MSLRLSPTIIQSDFVPMPGMANRHVMTIVSSKWVRWFPRLVAAQKRSVVDVHEFAKVVVECNIEPSVGMPRTIALIVHGLEGSSRSHYVMGLAQKFVDAGISAARMNMRNCGGSIHLSKTLYNAGLSSDVLTVSRHLLSEGFEKVILVGFSLGGNLVLKAAAEIARQNEDWLAAVCAVSPSLDLPACVASIEESSNRIYELNFLRSLKAKIRAKNEIHRGVFDIRLLPSINSIRKFDDAYTAPDGGYGSAADYYARASALPMMQNVTAPVLIVAAQDDPIVPFSSFDSPQLLGENITILAPICGGHAGFVGTSKINVESPQGCEADAIPRAVATVDHFWAENRCVDFCRKLVR